MSTPASNINARIVEAYLGHRLNHSELVDLVSKKDSVNLSLLEDTFQSYAERAVDWRADTSDQDLHLALKELGLQQQFDDLDEDEVWSPQERALYRRLSHLDFDPPSQELADSPSSLDPALRATIEQAFPEWNRDGDLALDAAELDYIMSGGFYGEKAMEANDPEKAAALSTMLRYNSLLGAGDPSDGSGVTIADLSAWENDPKLAASGAMSRVNEVYHLYQEQAKGINLPRPIASEQISGVNIHQGTAGSCVALSTLAGCSDAQLRKMITDNADGTLTITFADGPSEVINDPTLAERLYLSQGTNGDRWPAVIEIAMAQRLIGEGKSGKDGLREVINGIDPEFAIKAFSGRDAKRESIDELSLKDTRKLVQEALAQGGPVIAGSRPSANGDFINVEELYNGIVNGHCYAIKGYDGSSDSLTLQNPWHTTEWKYTSKPDGDGLFEMPLTEFYPSFRWLSYAK